jgi:hypothetical protein
MRAVRPGGEECQVAALGQQQLEWKLVEGLEPTQQREWGHERAGPTLGR